MNGVYDKDGVLATVHKIYDRLGCVAAISEKHTLTSIIRNASIRFCVWPKMLELLHLIQGDTSIKTDKLRWMFCERTLGLSRDATHR